VLQPDTANDPDADSETDSDAESDADSDTDDDESDDDDAGFDSKSLREQTIYIPYTKLRETFEKAGRGVFIPYEKFQELWKAARDKSVPDADPKPPLGAIITEVHNEATVGQDVVRVQARLKLDLLGKGWIEVPLRLRHSAILDARIGDEPARIVFDEAVGHKLLVEKKGAKPSQLVLDLTYARAFSKTPGQNSVAFEAPQAAVNRWRIRIPAAGVKVNIQPLIAATEIPSDVATESDSDDEPDSEAAPAGEDDPEAPADSEAGEGDEVGEDDESQPSDDQEAAEETVVLAFVGAAPRVTIDWTPETAGASGLEALATVQSQHEVMIDEGVIRTRARLAYEIRRAELSELRIRIPADHKVVNVFDANVRQWEIEQTDDTQTVMVQLFEPTRGGQNVIIELERFRGEESQQEVNVPVVQALDASRQHGLVVVRMAEGLRAEPTDKQGLFQLDRAELPGAMAQGRWEFVYRYSALPFELKLNVEKVLPRIRVDELVEAYLEPEQLTLQLHSLLHIERAGIFQMSLDIPVGYEVRQVQGTSAGGGQGVTVDSYRVEEEDDSRLVVDLAAKAIGDVGLFVELHKPLEDPNLLTPTGQAAELALRLPGMKSDDIVQRRGRLIVYSSESLRLNASEQQAARPISFKEAVELMPSMRGDHFPGAIPALAFSYSREPVELKLSAERRKSYVSAAQLLTVRVESGVVKYEATLHYNIRYSAIGSLRIDVPSKWAASIQNRTQGIREAVIEPPPDDLDEQDVAWRFSGDGELVGDVTLKLEWEQPIEELEVGKGTDLEVPVLKPRDVDRAWGQIVVGKAETIDVRPEETAPGLRPIDPQKDLMQGVSMQDAAMAFEFHDVWSLTLTATRYQLESVKRTSIEMGLLRMVVTRSDQTTVQALYRMRSTRQRLAVELPEGAEFDTEPLRINGQTVALERGDKNEYFIPLVGFNANESFLLELRYTVPGNQTQLEFPTFPGEPAVQRVYMCVYLPEELELLGTVGPWTSQIHWRWSTYFEQNPYPAYEDSYLINQVIEGASAPWNPKDGIQTDGKMYVFSTLRPAAPPDGALRMITMEENWLNAWIFGAVLIMGLLLLNTRFSTRLIAVALFFIGLILLGVFLPTFSRQVINGVLFSALFLVLLLWFVWYLIRIRPSRLAYVPPSRLAPAPGGMRAAASSPTPQKPATAWPSDMKTPAEGTSSATQSGTEPAQGSSSTDRPASETTGSETPASESPSTDPSTPKSSDESTSDGSDDPPDGGESREGRTHE
jgi:hypothetical protein